MEQIKTESDFFQALFSIKCGVSLIRFFTYIDKQFFCSFCTVLKTLIQGSQSEVVRPWPDQNFPRSKLIYMLFKKKMNTIHSIEWPYQIPSHSDILVI